MKQTLSDQELWLAAEFALGALGRNEMSRAERRFEEDRAFRTAVEGWQNQLTPLLDEVDDVTPPASSWLQIEKQIGTANAGSSLSDGSGFWKWMTGLATTAAAACFGLLFYVTEGDFAGQKVKDLQQSLAGLAAQVQEREEKVAELQSSLESANGERGEAETALSAAETALDQTGNDLAAAQIELEQTRGELAQVKDQIRQSKPLVASLTQSGDAPAFVAQYDPLKQALLIRTSVNDVDEKVPEIWLIPDQGDRKGEVLSLGVMDEKAPDTVAITDEFLPLIGEGGTLAITMEPPGGAPNGVATGPVIALGKLQALQQ
ncbi:MAG: anti-sigma factor [Pseudomonadota bacterium]